MLMNATGTKMNAIAEFVAENGRSGAVLTMTIIEYELQAFTNTGRYNQRLRYVVP